MDGGRIASVVSGSTAEPGDEQHRIGLPSICNLHSHAFQRGMAGLAEIRGTSSDSFWTWWEVMYRFVGRMTADDIEGVATQAYVEMRGGVRQSGGAGRADRRGRASDRHRANIVAGVLCACRIWRPRSRPRAAPF